MKLGNGSTLVCLHVEIMKAGKYSGIDLTQIGCRVVDLEETVGKEISELKRFFQAIFPRRLNIYLCDYSLDYDLLRLLHLTDVTGVMEFRENLELTEEGGERQVCVSEEEALQQLEKYLNKLTHPMLVGLDMFSLGLVMDRLGSYCKDKLQGWTTWSTLLQQLAPQFHQMDLEDFYQDVCGCTVKQYSTAADIASYLAVAVRKVVAIYLCSSTSIFWKPSLLHLVEPLGEATTENSLELYSSFRPSVATKIWAKKLETISISSEDEMEPTPSIARNNELAKKVCSSKKRKRCSSSSLDNFVFRKRINHVQCGFCFLETSDIEELKLHWFSSCNLNAVSSLSRDSVVMIKSVPKTVSNGSPIHRKVRQRTEAEAEGPWDKNGVLVKKNIKDEIHCAVTCRSIRIGNYKILPKEKFWITARGIQFKIPEILRPKEMITITILTRDIKQVMAHFSRSIPLLFLLVSQEVCEKIRVQLNMTQGDASFFDVESNDETQKAITVFPSKWTRNDQEVLKYYYESKLTVLQLGEANKILALSSPRKTNLNPVKK